ncbi:hypothetical protein NDU88_008136 [Pleurodeles waltl]|uniref:Uncharacterized protein n=1 Tax=Pleurodeles waltl TaxID=8319 RepID=A0AAV7N437_PLEWA|nr:hypothetical protein NDU88_008136 [Pleurodeles waltl]
MLELGQQRGQVLVFPCKQPQLSGPRLLEGPGKQQAPTREQVALALSAIGLPTPKKILGDTRKNGACTHKHTTYKEHRIRVDFSREAYCGQNIVKQSPGQEQH